MFEIIEHTKQRDCIGCESKHVCFCLVALLSSRPPQTMGQILEIPIVERKCLCVSRKVVLWSKHFGVRMLVPMSYVKLCNRVSFQEIILLLLLQPCSWCRGEWGRKERFQQSASTHSTFMLWEKITKRNWVLQMLSGAFQVLGQI